MNAILHIKYLQRVYSRCFAFIIQILSLLQLNYRANFSSKLIVMNIIIKDKNKKVYKTRLIYFILFVKWYKINKVIVYELIIS